MNRRALLASIAGLPLVGAAAAPGVAPIVGWDMGTGDFTALSVGCIERGSVVKIERVFYFQSGREMVAWAATQDATQWT